MADVTPLFPHRAPHIPKNTWRGRYPRKVVRMTDWLCPRPGDLAMVVKGERNLGRRVLVAEYVHAVPVGRSPLDAPFFFVEAVQGQLWVLEDGNHFQEPGAVFPAGWLRRLSRLSSPRFTCAEGGHHG